MLEVVMATGNFINANSKIRRNCQGIKISGDSLTALADTKSADNKSNLLEYIVKTLERSAPDVLSVGADLTTAKRASTINFATIMEGESAVLHFFFPSHVALFS